MIRAGDTYWLVASSINRVPGLPLLESPDLVNWRHAGNALPRLEPDDWFSLPRHGAGIWAPAIRFHDGLFHLFAPDPDRGVFVLTAHDPRGPWSAPELLLPGLGVIDPCPLWTSDGRAWLVFGWAKSRSGLANRLDVVEMSPDATRILGAPTMVVDGDRIEGCTVLEGPKFYERDGWYYLFAPAGGVTNGWQTVLRSRSVLGPYEHRVVLAQGSTDVNGPHQGAWVTSPEGEDWFVHFQDRGVFGRVVHLQPLRWTTDGWPVLGDAGEPVREHPLPARALGREPFAPQQSDAFDSETLGPQWQWQADPRADWLELRGDGVARLRAVPGDLGRLRSLGQVLGQQLPGQPTAFETELDWSGLEPGARAGVVVLGRVSAWLGVAVDEAGESRITSGRDPGDGGEVRGRHGALDPALPLRLRVESDLAGVVTFFSRQGREDAWVQAGEPFQAEAGQWISAEVGLFAASPLGAAGDGVAAFGAVEVGGM